MAKRFELIVFDWDGTLMDSAAAIVASIQAACRDMGVPEPEEAMARHVIGLGLHDALALAVPALPPVDYPRLADRYRYHYLSQDHELSLFPGILELLTRLHQAEHLLGVATGKSRRGLDRALAHSGLGALFHATRCADECHPKPDPEMLHELMDLFGVARERTLMIGDTTHDVLMARNAGVPALAVGFGAHPQEDLRRAEPLACVDSPQALDAWLRENA